MKKACNPREPEETPVPIIQPPEYQRSTSATFFCKQASCSLQHQSFLSVLQSASFTRFFSAHAAHAWFCSELTGSLSSYQSSGLMASPNKPSLSATAVEFLHSCESRWWSSKFKVRGNISERSDICELHMDQMTCPVSKCQCNSFMESKCIDVNALPSISVTLYSKSASPVRLDSHRPSCSRTSSLPTAFHEAWREGRWRFWKN